MHLFRWLKEFIQFGGIDVLIHGLEVSFELSRIQKTRLVGEWLRAIKAFTNNQVIIRMFSFAKVGLDWLGSSTESTRFYKCALLACEPC